ncbi:hypothetical protein ACIO87_10485 [Streptomyces sp. NPDC087218]|uniref:hypothetical protein n=1 Tax=Streptomyces sp. NPDC087218 TaxID=3365769 RepID=UPI0037FAB2EF
MRSSGTDRTAVRRDVHRSGRVRGERAMGVVGDTDEALVSACAPGAEPWWAALYAKARAGGGRSPHTAAFDVVAAGRREFGTATWQETDLLSWKPPAARRWEPTCPTPRLLRPEARSGAGARHRPSARTGQN